MKILFLYSEPLGYTFASARVMCLMGHTVDMVYWDEQVLTSFTPVSGPVNLHKRSQTKGAILDSLVDKISPDLAIVSGWMDRGYLRQCMRLRIKGVPTISLFDDQWTGSLRQRLGAILGSLGGLKLFFSHAAVAGPRQFEFAKRLGFSNSDVVMNALSGDSELYKPKIRRGSENERMFLYVGRFSPEKGILILINAWKRFLAEHPDWRLRVIGGGPLGEAFELAPNCEVIQWASSREIAGYAEEAQCAIVPSLRDQWGVVVHEFASMGLPLICSDKVGSAQDLVIPGYNGYVFAHGQADSLLDRMRLVASLPREKIEEMSQRSRALGSKFSPELTAHSLLSVVSTPR